MNSSNALFKLPLIGNDRLSYTSMAKTVIVLFTTSLYSRVSILWKRLGPVGVRCSKHPLLLSCILYLSHTISQDVYAVSVFNYLNSFSVFRYYIPLNIARDKYAGLQLVKHCNVTEYESKIMTVWCISKCVNEPHSR